MPGIDYDLDKAQRERLSKDEKQEDLDKISEFSP